MKNRTSRHLRTAAAVGTVAAMFAFTACSSSPDQGSGDGSISGDVNIIAYSGPWEEQFTESVIKPFEEANPDININYVSNRSSAEMLSGLQSEGSKPRTDIVIMDDSVSATANGLGLFAEITEENVPNVANVREEWRHPDNLGPALHLDAIGLLYDTETFDTPPTSWEELWNPEWDGQINLMAPPSLLGIAATAAASVIEGEDYTQSIDKGVERLKELAPRVQTFSPSPDEWQHIITGQSVIGIGQNGRGQYYADQSNGKLGIAFPEEGSFFQVNTINLVDGGPNTAAAEVFIDYALSADAQLAFAEALFYAPSTDVEIPDELADRLVATDGSMEMFEHDLDFLSEVRDPWTEIWNQEIITQ